MASIENIANPPFKVKRLLPGIPAVYESLSQLVSNKIVSEITIIKVNAIRNKILIKKLYICKPVKHYWD